MSKFVKTKFTHPNWSQKEIPKELGFSDSTLKGYRGDTKMRSNGLKAPQRPQKSSQEPVVDSAKTIMNKGSKLKGGVIDYNPIHGRDLIEQAFSNVSTYGVCLQFACTCRLLSTGLKQVRSQTK